MRYANISDLNKQGQVLLSLSRAVIYALGALLLFYSMGEALSLTFNDPLTVEIFGRIKHLG